MVTGVARTSAQPGPGCVRLHGPASLPVSDARRIGFRVVVGAVLGGVAGGAGRSGIGRRLGGGASDVPAGYQWRIRSRAAR